MLSKMYLIVISIFLSTFATLPRNPFVYEFPQKCIAQGFFLSTELKQPKNLKIIKQGPQLSIIMHE
jgi:hypothetical protein